MQLDVFVLERRFQFNLTPEMLMEGAPMFEKMDRDMDRGRKIGLEYVEHPDRVQRAQVAADRLLVAIDTHNEALIMAMSGYILSRLPEVRTVRIDTDGEPLNTSLQDASGQEIRA